MHEDVNEINKKPYVEYKDADDRTDEDCATEYWTGLKAREKSVFVDTFYG